MKNLLILFTIISLNFSCKGQEKFSDEALLQKLISTTGNDSNLDKIIAQNKGKVVLIEVWASWCGDCIKNLPKVKEMQQNLKDVSFVFLSCDKSNDAWLKGIEKHELSGQHYFIPDGMKGDFAKTIDLTWIPRYIILDKNGKIALYNAVETDNEKVYQILKKLL